MQRQLITIGHNVFIDFVGYVNRVPAKIDTGADKSSVWVSDINVSQDGQLSFVLFGRKSPYYTGEIIKTANFSVSKVRNSTGHEQIRYRTEILVNIAGKQVKALFTLSDRSLNTYPVLIGRRTLHNRFLVDVAKKELPNPVKKQHYLNDELTKDPYKFHQKYHGNSS